MCTAMLIVSDEVETSKPHHPPWPAPQHPLLSCLLGLIAMAQTQLALRPFHTSHAQVLAAWEAATLLWPSAAGTKVNSGLGWNSCGWSCRPSTHGGLLSRGSPLPTAANNEKERESCNTMRKFCLSHDQLYSTAFFPLFRAGISKVSMQSRLLAHLSQGRANKTRFSQKRIYKCWVKLFIFLVCIYINTESHFSMED